jgi:hypothetical protein
MESTRWSLKRKTTNNENCMSIQWAYTVLYSTVQYFRKVNMNKWKWSPHWLSHFSVTLEAKYKIFPRTWIRNWRAAGKNLMHNSCAMQIFQGTVSQDFRPLVFFVKQYPWVQWFMGYIGFEYRFVFAEIFDYENRLFSILFYCHWVGKIT